MSTFTNSELIDPLIFEGMNTEDVTPLAMASDCYFTNRKDEACYSCRNSYYFSSPCTCARDLFTKERSITYTLILIYVCGNPVVTIPELSQYRIYLRKGSVLKKFDGTKIPKDISDDLIFNVEGLLSDDIETTIPLDRITTYDQKQIDMIKSYSFLKNFQSQMVLFGNVENKNSYIKYIIEILKIIFNKS